MTTAKNILDYDPKTIVSGEMERRMIKFWRARSAIKPSRNGSNDSSNRSCPTRKMKMKTKKQMSVPL